MCVSVELSVSADYTRGGESRRREQKAEEDQAARCDHSGDNRGGEAATGDPECEGLFGRDTWDKGSVQDLRKALVLYAKGGTCAERYFAI